MAAPCGLAARWARSKVMPKREARRLAASALPACCAAWAAKAFTSVSSRAARIKMPSDSTTPKTPSTTATTTTALLIGFSTPPSVCGC